MQKNAIATLAPAKVNLSLHVTGQRKDGFHLLDSLVTFVDVGDRLAISRHDVGLTLEIDGNFANDVSVHDNLVLKAGRMIMPADGGATFRLTKNIPVASGLGGGSGDAAAALRLGAEYWKRPLPGLQDQLKLGADVPVCLKGESVRMQGIGEKLTPIPQMPQLHMVLLNPGIPLATAEVFAALEKRNNPPMDTPPKKPGDLAKWLNHQRNDLQTTAVSLRPSIGDCLSALVHQGAILARMSGSGASCFGLFESAHLAEHAALAIEKSAPGWWVEACNSIRH
jgi:4-diphosphocytidyl-2-C-methyl-D-erythritol kinase